MAKSKRKPGSPAAVQEREGRGSIYFLDLSGDRTLRLRLNDPREVPLGLLPASDVRFPSSFLMIYRRKSGEILGIDCSGSQLEPEVVLQFGEFETAPYPDGAVLERSYDELKRESMKSGNPS